MNRKAALALAVVVVVAAAGAASITLAQEKKQDRETKVRSDKDRVEADGKWIYDDLPRGVAEATKSGKPLLVVFRCIPCEACAKLDEDVVSLDPKVAALLGKFVLVRIPHANGMDLSRFQFDYDQSWAAFMLNADMTIYGRYGTRSSQKDSADDVSLEGFAKALQGALDLHAKFPDVKASLAAKRGNPLEARTPEEYPSFGGKYAPALDYGKDKKVVPSCIHCHQLGEAQRRFYRDAGKPVPESVVFPYPNPKVLGLALDPKERARVRSVAAGSSAEKDGFRAGDEIASLEGQPMLSVADVQWLLHHAGETGSLKAEVVRDGKTVSLAITLAAGWRLRGDISWRATSWDLRRMTTGGMVIETLAPDERSKARIKDGAMALRVKYAGGKNGPHGAARQAGFQEGDVIVSVDGRTDVMSESAWMTWLVNAKKPGDKVAVTVLRDGKTVELTLPMQ